MKDAKADAREHNIEQEYDLDAPPEKVWRAISIAEFRENWLPKAPLKRSCSVSTRTPAASWLVCWSKHERGV